MVAQLDARCFQDNCLWDEHARQLAGVPKMDGKVKERLHLYQDLVQKGMRVDLRILNPETVTDDQLHRFIGPQA